jgi:hypothetical protein
MAAVKSWLSRLEMRTLVWLARGRSSSCVIVGTLVAAGLGAAALGSQPSASGQQGQQNVVSSALPMSAYGCYNDPDGDGHIWCDGSVAISKLPASYGQCHTSQYGPDAIMCRGTGW